MLPKERFLIREGFFVTPFRFREGKLYIQGGMLFPFTYLLKMSLKSLKQFGPKSDLSISKRKKVML